MASVVGRGRASRVRRHRRARRPVVHDRRGPDLRADRSERRGQDDAVQLRQPPLRADERRASRSTAATCSRCPRTASRGSASPARSRTSRCSRRSPSLENVMVGGYTHGRVERARAAPKRSRSSSGSSLDRSRRPARGRPAVRHAEAHRDRARARRAARGCCCSTSPPPASRTPRSTSSASSSATIRDEFDADACCSSSTTWRW